MTASLATMAANKGDPLRLPIFDCPILVVDDTEFNRVLIGALLREAGYADVSFAKDGVEALRMVAERIPDLLILDIMMPHMDGFEVCARLRADGAYADLPVLVQTALSSNDDRNRAFASGTTDLIAKPIDRAELLARVRIHLENRLLLRSLRAYSDRVEGELAMARGMYEHLLPSDAMRTTIGTQAGLRLEGLTLLSSEMGGDLWGVLPVAPPRVGLFLLDLPERGVAAALNAFRLHTLIHELAGLTGDPGAFLTALNERAAGLLDPGAGASVLYGVVDTQRDAFVYAAAAATGPLLTMPMTGMRLAGNGDGPALGAAPHTRYETRRLPFPAGSALVLHSATAEAALRQRGGIDDPEPLSSLVSDALASGGDAFAVVREAIVAASGAASGAAAADDVSVVWIDRLGG